MSYRQAGVLLHITSLPGKYGIGTVGKEAYNFVDYLKGASMKLWQILPLSPTSYGDSPYQSVSSNAMNYYLIDLEELIEEGLLTKEFCDGMNFGGDDRVSFSLMFENKILCLKEAFMNFNKRKKDFKEFVNSKKYHDFALFMTIKTLCNNNEWSKWPKKYQNYSLELEEQIINERKQDYLFWVFTQYIFEKQWFKLKTYANNNGIKLIGDIPLYIAYDSVEVWKYPHMFILDENKRMINVAGCPPDAFSDDGQLWGNPVYDWPKMKEDGYTWWHNRILNAFEFVDVLRIDHFRGFDRYYSIPSDHINARNGSWVDGPKYDLFKDLKDCHIIAEDLGLIDEGVHQLLRETGYPGMKILEFAFDGNVNNEHKPSNYTNNYVVYTGTHDNMPLYQYYIDLTEVEKETFKRDLRSQLGLFNLELDETNEQTICQSVIRLAFASIADTCIIPMQDLLYQGKDKRMNLPSTVSTDNWSYRIKPEDLSLELQNNLFKLAKESNRG